MARRYCVRHHQAIWETSSFEVDVPDHIDDPEEWIAVNLSALLSDAMNQDRADIAAGDAVEGVDSELEITQA